MSEHMKKHSIKAHSDKSILYVMYQHHVYAIPKKIVEKYEVEAVNTKKIKLNAQYTKAGVMIKGLRLRDNLTQIEFAKKLNITQANLSNMENGRRPIGKEMAKRIAKIFQIDYRVFL